MSIKHVEPVVKSNGQFSDFSYMYDEDARGVADGHNWHGIVICTFTPSFEDLLVEVKRVCPMYDATDLCNTIAVMNLADQIKTRAYCSVNDTFDLTTGMTIARKKALFDYNCRKADFFIRLLTEIDKCRAQVGEKLNRVRDSVENLSVYLTDASH